MTFFPNFSTLVEIGSLQIHYYALLILAGALFAYSFGQYNFKKLGYQPEILSDYFVSVLVLGIIGARIWYVIFMWNEIYSQNLAEIIAIWHGGLAIQGGLMVGIIYSYFYFKKKNVPFFVAGDAILPGVLIAQACGRWGNFFNQEAYGGITTLSFLKSLHLPSFVIDHMYIAGNYHQPTFLYESLGNVLVFLVIVLIIKKMQKIPGQQFFTYFIGYGIVRFIVEGMRTDSLMLGPLRIAQVLSILFIIVGIGGQIYLLKQRSVK